MLYADLQFYPLRTLNQFIRLLAFSWLAGCAMPMDTIAAFPEAARAAHVDGVPRIQQDAFYCGPASIAMVMQWAGNETTQVDIAALAFNPGAEGTYQADMIGSSRRLGQLAVEISTFDQLLAEIAAGHPVIVFQNLGLGIAPVWHYGVVTGYDLEQDAVYLNSGQEDQMVLPFDLFARTWRRGENWALVVLPPDQLPVSAGQTDVLSAAAALERVGQYAAAETLYETGAARWPDNWLWHFGLGNARYAMNDLRGARAAFRRARALAPRIPEVRNNLAHVESELRG